MPMKIQSFAPDEIVIDPALRVRKGEPDMDHVQTLTTSFAKFGQRVPGIVRKQKDGTYLLEAGEHRLLGVRGFNELLGPGEEPMKFDAVVVNHDDKAALVGAILENVIRKDMDEFEQADAMAKLAQDGPGDEKGKKQTEIAELFGVTPARVSQLLSLGEVPKKIQKMVADGDIEADAAILVCKLAPDDKLRQEILEESVRHRNNILEMERRYDEHQAEKQEEQKIIQEAMAEKAELKALQSEFKTKCKEAKAAGESDPKPPKRLVELIKKNELTPEQKRVADNVRKSAKADKAKKPPKPPKVSPANVRAAAKAKGVESKAATPSPISRKQFLAILEAIGADKTNPVPKSARDLMGKLEARFDDEITDTQLRNALIKYCVPDSE